jgi:hypothetical protein
MCPTPGRRMIHTRPGGCGFLLRLRQDEPKLQALLFG